jgi:ATP-dependent 26S proteasome regulatory subunit
MARALQPSLVVLEDVDLVAEERTLPGGARNPLLFELLNEMDGVADDADVAFLLTTNRADLLEPALAARPGRVDLAVAIDLPDPTARLRLIQLYGRGLDMHVDNLDNVVDRTEGVSAAFIRELLRRAAHTAADRFDDTIVLDNRSLNDALEELLDERQVLTRVMLGSQPHP